MAKKVIRYLLEGNPGSVPAFVENGGYFPLGDDLVGLSVDEDKRFVPSTVVRLTKDELKARAIECSLDEQGQYRIDINTRQPFTQESVYANVEHWLAMMGIPDYE